MSTTVESATDIRPFYVEIPDEKVADLRRRIGMRRRCLGFLRAS